MSDQKIEPNPEEPIVFSKDVNRRDFLKVSGATAGAAAVVGVTGRPVLRMLEEVSSKQPFADTGEQIYPGACRWNCSSYCQINVHVRDGRVVKTSAWPGGDPKGNKICSKGLTHPQRMYNPDRIKYPMKRAGERGENKWERISWDEAITTITDQWKSFQAKNGNTSVAFFKSSGNQGIGHTTMMPMRLKNAIGATGIDSCVDMAYIVGTGRLFGGLSKPCHEMKDVLNSKVIFFWGANITEATLQGWHWVADAIENGTPVIVIDPVYTHLASKADYFIQVRPGSDTALMMSMMQVIVSKDLHAKEFLVSDTVAPFLVRGDTKLFLRMSELGVPPTEGPLDATGKPTLIDPVAVWDATTNTAVAVNTADQPALEGSFEVNGIQVRTAFDLLKEEINKFPPEEASKLTDVDPETINFLAMMAVKTPVFHGAGYGPQAYNNGVHIGHAMGTLSAITGNLCMPGASTGSSGFSPAFNWSLSVPPTTTPLGPTIGELQLREVVKSGKYKGEPFPINSLYIYCNNLICCSSNTKEWLNEVWPKLDLIVVAELEFSDTARYADIVLPVAYLFEEEDIHGWAGAPYLMYNEKAVDPPFECKPDGEICRLIAEKMGVGEYFSMSDEEFLDGCITSTILVEKYGSSLKTLREKKFLRYQPEPYIAYESHIYGTPTGRIEFYVEKPKVRLDGGQNFDADQERLPHFFPPYEAWPENPLFKKYPLVLNSERARFRTHSQGFATPWLHELEPEPIVKINLLDASARGIQNGDYVEVYNDRGHAVAKAVVTQGQRPGIMIYPKGWQMHQHKAGSWSELLHSAYDPIGVNQSFMDCLVEVRRWNGEV